ncbi:unnamed protein product [Lepeophtheirus salmonis]|uniref:(salmon louse) hypothetical protein n=1 Tax=Lepeophtheirus salmonis TaxID=72036 RepID=A0A7R8CSJ2_LEPSM|nr:unnamed protein product [Lepeophtheirus salmonis]CAF2878119.1 unnamed protein product [Lepeophtheirus salmonis]
MLLTGTNTFADLCHLTKYFSRALSSAHDLILSNMWDASSMSCKKCSRASMPNMTLPHIHLIQTRESMPDIQRKIFIENIMQRIHQMTENVQMEELNIIDTTDVIKSTVKNLSMIRDETKAMKEEIVGGIMFLKKIGVHDPEAEIKKTHRCRKQPL